MRPYPELLTDRLLLNAPKAKDIPCIVQHAASPHIAAYTLNLPHPYTEADAIYWLNQAHQGWAAGTHLILGIRLQDTEQLIGGTGLTIEPKHKRAEIGYWIAEPFWHCGYATEAAGAVIDYAFRVLMLHKITSSHFGENPASGQVMQKCGLRQEGELKEQLYKGSRYHSLLLYGRTRNDL